MRVIGVCLLPLLLEEGAASALISLCITYAGILVQTILLAVRRYYIPRFFASQWKKSDPIMRNWSRALLLLEDSTIMEVAK